MLNNAKAAAAAAAAGKKTGGSKVQQLLAGREDPVDTVNLSPVAKFLKSQEAEKAKTATPYTEQDWYLQAKVAELKNQIAIYSNLPGLDPSGSVMEQLTKEVNELVKKQQEKLKKTQADADAAKAKLAEQEKQKALDASIPSVDTLLKRAKAGANGEYVPDFESTVQTDASKEKNAAVEAMLKKVGAKVNTTA